ncbi:MAG TPA: TetR/AcrR family transcriptional regulator [Gammaproteobacteria bacterium]
MGRRSDHSREEIREMAITAATRIVTGQGLAKLTARGIAQDIGYTVGTLYLAFENLDDLILHVNAKTLEELHAGITAAARDLADPKRRLAAMSKAYIELANRQPRRWNAVFEHSLVDTEIPDWYRQRIDALLLLVEAEFRQLAPHKSDTEIWIAARTLWAGIHGISMAALTSTPVIKKPDMSWQLASSLIENYLTGFLR